jgi:FlaG/FlaF family flagellin (archaellin)
MKKGVSPAISWILLIGLSITLAGIVTVWVRTTAEDTAERITQNVESDIRCSDVSINTYEESSNCSKINIQNKGLFSIHAIKVISLGNVEEVSTSPQFPLKPGDSTSIPLNIVTPLPGNKIGIIPVTKVDKDMLACMEKEISVSCS